MEFCKLHALPPPGADTDTLLEFQELAKLDCGAHCARARSHSQPDNHPHRSHTSQGPALAGWRSKCLGFRGQHVQWPHAQAPVPAQARDLSGAHGRTTTRCGRDVP